MTDIFALLNTVVAKLESEKFDFVVIGGLAVQIWGEPRVTRDIDLSVMTRFESEFEKVELLLKTFVPRTNYSTEFQLANRVVLCKWDGIGIDIGLGAFDFEESMFSRRVKREIYPGVSAPFITAEDLIVMKVFAGRDQDWFDVRGILVRQSGGLDFDYIKTWLGPMLELIEQEDRVNRFWSLVEELQQGN